MLSLFPEFHLLYKNGGRFRMRARSVLHYTLVFEKDYYRFEAAAIYTAAKFDILLIIGKNKLPLH